MDYIETVSGGVFPYNSRIFGYDWDPQEQILINYLTNSSKVADLYSAIHIENSTKVPIF